MMLYLRSRRSVTIVSVHVLLLLLLQHHHHQCSAFPLGNNIPSLPPLSHSLVPKRITSAITESTTTTICNKRSHQDYKIKINSLCLVPSLLAVTTSLLLLTPVVLPPANAAAPTIITATSSDESEIQGLKSITQSQLGKSIRRTVIDGARAADQFDLQWERFSDSLRDEQKCDPVTHRRLFDNGYRRDGTRIGNPVLGALCNPDPLKYFNDATAKTVLDAARVAAVDVIATSFTADGQRQVDQTTLLSMLQDRLDQVEQLVSPSFSRATASVVASSSPKNEDTNTKEQEIKRQSYNKDMYTQMRAYGEVLTETMSRQGSTSNDVKLLRERTRAFDRAWGNSILTALAPSANRNDFQSPFPQPDPTEEQPYNEEALLDALGAVSMALHNMQDGGLVGHWEISIPEDGNWNVVTIAVDDDISIGGQILARERSQTLDGSAVVALVRSAMDDRAKISYKLDTFFIDPTTTRQELYNPTQLLVSLSDLGQ